MMTAPCAIVTGMASPGTAPVASGARHSARRAEPVRASRATVLGRSTGSASHDPISTIGRGTRLTTRAARDVDVDAARLPIPEDFTEKDDCQTQSQSSQPIQKQVWEGLYGKPSSIIASTDDFTSANAFDPDEFIRKLDKEFLTGTSDDGSNLGTQGDAVAKGNAAAVLERALDPDGGIGDLDYLQELIAIQAGGPKNVGFFGTRNMGFLHQQLVEILSYALVLTENHIFTSGATGTNAAVIRGALRAERPDLLTVILPQSVLKQPEESRELLKKVENVLELKYDALPLSEASRKCNDDILAKVQQVICFAFHDSNLLLDTCHEAKMQRKLVALFYLD